MLLGALAVALLLAAGLATSAHATNVRANGEVKATCTSITFRFFGFPNANNNTVTEHVTVHNELVATQQFSFNGPEGTNTIPITVPPGSGTVDGLASWNTNGFKGSFDVATALNCSFPNFTIEKQQEVEGSGEGFTTAPVQAVPGNTLKYEITVTNTGNTSLTFGPLADPYCGTVTGGPGGPLAPGESATYFCSHMVTLSDEQKAEQYANTATIAATPPKSQGLTLKKKSNTVIAKFPKAHERPNGEVLASCNSITFVYRKFPNAPNNTVTERVQVNHETVLIKKFTFNGPSGEDTIHITVPPGTTSVDGLASWNTNGFKGNWDVIWTVHCEATPAFTIAKQQKIEGSAEGFTSGPITATVGQTIDYQITVGNTGNTSLTFSNFTDTHCSGVAGGPVGALPYEHAATYTCSHTVTLADTGQPYENAATVTAAPPAGEGSEITQTSNTVVANVPFVPQPAFTVEKLQRADGAGSYTTEEIHIEANATLEYEIVVKDTGNEPLTLGVADAECAGPISGGPSEGVPLQPGESTTYTCSRPVVEAHEGELFDNTATVTGTPPQGGGAPVMHESNPVVAEVGGGLH
jgi:uncharacterized repeat protein (TIGR01451 family)